MALTRADSFYLARSTRFSLIGFDFFRLFGAPQRVRIPTGAGIGDSGHGSIDLCAGSFIHITLTLGFQGKSAGRAPSPGAHIHRATGRRRPLGYTALNATRSRYSIKPRLRDVRASRESARTPAAWPQCLRLARRASRPKACDMRDEDEAEAGVWKEQSWGRR